MPHKGSKSNSRSAGRSKETNNKYASYNNRRGDADSDDERDIAASTSASSTAKFGIGDRHGHDNGDISVGGSSGTKGSRRMASDRRKDLLGKKLPYFVNGNASPGSRKSDSDFGSEKGNKRSMRSNGHLDFASLSRTKIEFVDATELTLKHGVEGPESQKRAAQAIGFDAKVDNVMTSISQQAQEAETQNNAIIQEAIDVAEDSDDEIIFVTKNDHSQNNSDIEILDDPGLIAWPAATAVQDAEASTSLRKPQLPEHVADLLASDVDWGETGIEPISQRRDELKNGKVDRKAGRKGKKAQQKSQARPISSTDDSELDLTMQSDLSAQEMAIVLQSMGTLDLDSGDLSLSESDDSETSLDGQEAQVLLDLFGNNMVDLDDAEILLSDESIPSSLSSAAYAEYKLIGTLNKGSIGVESPENESATEEIDSTLSEASSEEPVKRRSKVDKRKGRKMDALDEMLQAQWEKDRQTKAKRKQDREAERIQALLDPYKARHSHRASKKAELRRNSRQSAAGDRDEANLKAMTTMQDINMQISSFLQDDGKTTLSLPPCHKQIRARVHQLAGAYNLKSKSVGGGVQRFTILYKTKMSGKDISKKKVGWILGQGTGEWGIGAHSLRSDRSGDSRSRKSTGRSVTSGHASILTPKPIAETNVGLNLLSSLGWSAGQQIGISGTALSAPLTAVARASGAGLGT